MKRIIQASLSASQRVCVARSNSRIFLLFGKKILYLGIDKSLRTGRTTYASLRSCAINFRNLGFVPLCPNYDSGFALLDSVRAIRRNIQPGGTHNCQ
jgi:hypothetical protein